MKNLKSINSFLNEEQDIIDDLGDLGFKSLKGWVFIILVESTLYYMYIIAETEEHASNLLWTMFDESKLVAKDDEEYAEDIVIEDGIDILEEVHGNKNFKMIRYWDNLKPTSEYRNGISREFIGDSDDILNPIKMGETLKSVFSNGSDIFDK